LWTAQDFFVGSRSDLTTLTRFSRSETNGRWESYRCRPGYCIGQNRCDTGTVRGANAVACLCRLTRRNFHATSGRRNFSANPICGACDAGYSEWGGKCIPCTTVEWRLLIGLFFVRANQSLAICRSSTYFSGIHACWHKSGKLGGRHSGLPHLELL